MPAETLHFSDLAEKAASLSFSDFEKFMLALRSKRAQKRSPNVLSKAETELLERIYRLFPAEKKARIAFLNDQIWDETIREKDQTELLALVEEHENWAAERIENVRKLADLRGVEFLVLSKQLGLFSDSDHA